MSIAPYQQNGAAVAVPVEPPAQVSAVAQLVEWAHGAQAAHEVAVNLVNTSFCPAHYRPKHGDQGEAAYNATAAILAGLEVGLQPMAALQAFHSIQGVAAPKAVTLRAIVQSHGHDIWVEEQSTTRAVVAGRRKGSDQVQRSEWTIERATLAGLPGKNPNWRTQAPAMLVARATSECARMIASDAILGIPYSVEELEDGGGPVQAVAEQVVPPTERPATRRRNPTSMLPAAPPAQSEPEPGPEPVGEAPGSTRLDPKGEVLAGLVSLLGQRFAGRPEALAFVGELVGREVHHFKDLTHAEAQRVADRLNASDIPPAEASEASADQA